ncbi:MAG TPA: aminopeptidase P N-terminal domain-containing protein [Saprospiraceae bacterium]|nr:aminopeptidase P N-terminal domain-containing protein [Saprospiraceae bacterium]
MRSILFLPLVFLGLLASIDLGAQQLPDDYLSPDFHTDRRDALRQKMPPNSVAVLFAAPVRNRANDVEFIYHQDPNFYYLTGYKEPHSILLIFSEPQKDATGGTYDEILFAQARNEQSEMWTGRRLGPEGVKETLGFETVLDHTEFKNYALEFERFDKVLFFDFQRDIRDNPRDDTDLFDLKQQFRGSAGIAEDFNGVAHQMHQVMANTSLDLASRKQQLYQMSRANPKALNDPLVKAFMAAKDQESTLSVVQKIPKSNLDVGILPQLMGQLREAKTKEELELMRIACEVSAVGQLEVMKAMKPGMSETEVQGIHEFVFKKYGSEYEGYPSIVGGGNNGCILHYIENNKPRLGTDLVLMDLGAEYHGYTADVTRTIPADGTFSEEQKIIYNIVLEAQQAGFEECKVGNAFRAPGQAAREVIDQRLAEIGLIEAGERHNYFPHGSSHYVGLDVHDPGTYDTFKPGTIITVEPGIYIPEGSDCDPKWWGIAVRIEDCILITEDGWVNLSGRAPRTVEEIEKTMAMPSPLDDFILPTIKKP